MKLPPINLNNYYLLFSYRSYDYLDKLDLTGIHDTTSSLTN